VAALSEPVLFLDEILRVKGVIIYHVQAPLTVSKILPPGRHLEIAENITGKVRFQILRVLISVEL